MELSFRAPTKRVQGMIFCGKEEGQRSGRMSHRTGVTEQALRCPDDVWQKKEYFSTEM